MSSRSLQFGGQLEQAVRAQWNFVEIGLLFPKAKRILNGLGEQGADRNGTHLAGAFDAERIGLTVPQTLLATADDVIE